MRRVPALLLVAGLAAAPASAVAGPSPHNNPWSQQSVESFEWSTSQGRLGMEVMSLTPELRVHFGATKNRGVIVARVERGSPADLAGIDVGDVIVGVRGKAIENAPDVLSAISNAKKGDRVMIDVVRDGRRRSLEATLTADVPAFGNGTSGSAWMRQWMAPPDTNADGKQLHDLMRSFGPEGSGAIELRKWFEELHDLLVPVPQSRDSA